MHSSAPPRIVGGFAGVGWAEGLRRLGLTEIGLELDPAACTTRHTAGHPVIRCDITQYPTAPFRGFEGGIFSPPCPPFSKSGNGAGAVDLALVQEGIRDLAAGRDTRAALTAACTDPRSALTAEPMRWYYDLRPEWVCMEQVPAVMPLWELYAEALSGWGYSTACAVLDAAGFGLGQHRKRAVFVASRVREAVLPAPTYGGSGQPPLRSMSSVLGWGYTRRPSPTVTGGGTGTGGAEPFGNGSRRAMRAAMGQPGAWLDGPHGTRPRVADCAALQGFRPGLQWHGRLGQQHLQVGNAVPPLLAEHIVAAVTGLPTAAAQPAAVAV